MSLNNLETDIIAWGAEKGILPNPDKVAQFNKTMEEAGELAQGIVSNNRDEVSDAIGDIFVTLVMQCQAWDLTMEECVQGAYDIISKRTGKMVDGVFVKDED